LRTKQEVIDTLDRLLKINIQRRDKCKEGEEFSYNFYEGKCLAYYNALSLVREIGEEGAGEERR